MSASLVKLVIGFFMQTDWSFQTIGIIHSPFKQKFGIPRQAGLAQSTPAQLVLVPPFNCPQAVIGLEQFSHLWLSFVFHQSMLKKWQPTVRPPRLGGNKKMGVFATRSPFRANPLGLSVVQLDRIEHQKSGIILHLLGADLMDGTPILDIKPYIRYADCLTNAISGFAETAPSAQKNVIFSDRATNQIKEHPQQGLKTLIIEILSLDPRPAYQKDNLKRDYGIQLFDLDIKWHIVDENIEVIELIKL